jgi:CheY-like chemotaxis protein
MVSTTGVTLLTKKGAEISPTSVKVILDMARLVNLRKSGNRRGYLGLTRVLLFCRELTARLTLQTILQAGGYSVDAAATPAESLTKLDEHAFDLVLADASAGEAGLNVLAYARVKSYRPATAVITATQLRRRRAGRRAAELAIQTENVPALLGKIADLIGSRAIRRLRPAGHALAG